MTLPTHTAAPRLFSPWSFQAAASPYADSGSLPGDDPASVPTTDYPAYGDDEIMPGMPSDPIPNPEPEMPSLPDPDPGIYTPADLPGTYQQ